MIAKVLILKHSKDGNCMASEVIKVGEKNRQSHIYIEYFEPETLNLTISTSMLEIMGHYYSKIKVPPLKPYNKWEIDL